MTRTPAAIALCACLILAAFTDEELLLQRQRDQDQTHALAHPADVRGNPESHPSWMRSHSVGNYIAAYGEEFTAQPLPTKYEYGSEHYCYENAARVVAQDPRLSYVEGYAFSSDLPGVAFMHAWAVDHRTKLVVDPTWRVQRGRQYFGVRYDRDRFLAFIRRVHSFGVLTSANTVAALEVIATGGRGLRP